MLFSALSRCSFSRLTPAAAGAVGALAAVTLGERRPTHCENVKESAGIEASVQRRVTMTAETLAKPSLSVMDAPSPAPPPTLEEDLFLSRLDAEYSETDWSDLPPEDDDTECGFCLFMRASPCSNHFRRWEACVNVKKENGIVESGGNDSGELDENVEGGTEAAGEEDDFVTRCALQTAGLARCMERFPEHFRSPDVHEEKDDEATEKTWNDTIVTLEATDREERGGAVAFTPFPTHLVPSMEVRLETRTGRASFQNHSQIAVGYVKDETGRLLVAANAEQITNNPAGAGTLIFSLPDETVEVTAYVLYEEGDGKNGGKIFAKSMLVPKKGLDK
mmetsp:Transcript_26780/g.53423  ORF Transcript_26780/g.53423 Transcript_26780/m.53423 type:complete len:334 (-) Transcript_26780:133-1134(-)|eukprot:CAMPEP_0194329600 /NCGR_PEP_ID=MMETSP0171-20130528/48797_1 /TAXON_ID=218684 /ORGANISM="Corethron pennatum, Strain L29A3" /LENGTH=333 /DNA_ID=CAMNT_0039090377 /DNA_START=29 /DNA_END=1030 /DNA_ORIENTATION=-